MASWMEEPAAPHACRSVSLLLFLSFPPSYFGWAFMGQIGDRTAADPAQQNWRPESRNSRPQSTYHQIKSLRFQNPEMALRKMKCRTSFSTFPERNHLGTEHTWSSTAKIFFQAEGKSTYHRWMLSHTWTRVHICRLCANPTTRENNSRIGVLYLKQTSTIRVCIMMWSFQYIAY